MDLSSNVEAEDNSLRIALMEERNVELKKIARDSELLSESFQEVSKIVKEHGQKLDRAVESTEAASVSTSVGNEFLRQASERRRFWVGTVAATFGTLVVTVFGVMVVSNMTKRE
uniref:t-SNARE coiled-coil homology domain-containing protein n=1 Tax=viral metagenome TaxID=1070528 RepID=A0A6C0CIG1_9ZZZZ